MKYEIVRYNPDLKSQIVELQKHLWGPDQELNAACLEWKYGRNPYLEIPLIYVALYQGRVVGMRGMFGTKWKIGNPCQTFVIPCASDSVIAPDHRNQGLFAKMTKVALDDLRTSDYLYSFNLSAGALAYVNYLTMGWRSIGSLQVAKRLAGKGSRSGGSRRYAWRIPFVSGTLRRLEKAASNLLFPVSSGKKSPFRWLDRNSKKGWHTLSSNVFVEKLPRPTEMVELIERIGSDGRLQHVRDQQYFTWRFQNPRSAYRFLFWKNDRLEGYLILRASVSANKVEIKIVDWEASSATVRTDLLHAAIQWGNFETLKVWSVTLSDEIKAFLRASGWILEAEPKSVAEHSPRILVRPIREEMIKEDWVLANRRLLDLNNWDLRMIYSDGN